MPFDFEGRVFVVANRLPITIRPIDDHFNYDMSSGGLVSGLRSLSKAVKFKWFGWPGFDIHRNDRDRVRHDLQEQYNAVPVFLTDELAQKHYNGFSNSVLWPLMHRMPERVVSKESWASAYREVNELFADVILPYVEDRDIIWVHDYHLLLLPGILRQRLSAKKNIRIGFFLHTPFPTEDYFTILPFREDICRSLLLCDVVGFHTNAYARDFLDSARIVLDGVSRSPSDLHWAGRKVVVHGFPIGIEPEDFKQRMRSEEVQKEMGCLEKGLQGQRIVLGVDRLDYIKGIPQKLKAFDRLLTKHPEWLGKVTMIQLAIPTRAEVSVYQRLKEEVEQLVGHINGKHGTFTYTPIHYLYKSIKPEELCALYAIADVCIISSLRDGLNMVSYEYVACQTERKGVLMMSSYAGAAKTLPECMILNPWDTPRFADKMARALEMPMDERERRQSANSKVVDSWTSIDWGVSFLKAVLSKDAPREDALPDRDAISDSGISDAQAEKLRIQL